MSTPEPYKGFIHTTPLEVVNYLYAWPQIAYLAYFPSNGWRYVHKKEEDSQYYLPLGFSPLVTISTAQIDKLVRCDILSIPCPDLSDEEFEIQSGLGTSVYSKIRYLRPGITIEEIRRKLHHDK